MTLAALAFAVALGATPQQPSQIEEGCGFVPGSRLMVPIEVGVFFDSPTPAFVDERFRAVRVGSSWQRSDRSPYSGGETRAWFRDGAPLRFGGRTYTKRGFPRILQLSDLAFGAEHDGLAVMREAGGADTGVVYIQTKGGQCEFQPYFSD